MGAAAREARVLKTVADIRALQMRAAESEHARAEQARQIAAGRLESGRAAVREAEQGWLAATAARSFDPTLSRVWLHALETRRGQERALEEAGTQAAKEADDRRAALRIAQARSDASREQARRAARAADRRREEVQLAAIEDQLNAKRRAA